MIFTKCYQVFFYVGLQIGASLFSVWGQLYIKSLKTKTNFIFQDTVWKNEITKILLLSETNITYWRPTYLSGDPLYMLDQTCRSSMGLRSGMSVSDKSCRSLMGLRSSIQHVSHGWVSDQACRYPIGLRWVSANNAIFGNSRKLCKICVNSLNFILKTLDFKFYIQ